jgi:hypothetical protein
MTSKRTGHPPAIVAHHEAGHAVIAHMLGCRVERVSIDEDSGASLIKWSGRGDQRTERQILSNLAGPYSQRRARTGEAAAMPVSPAATISITSPG